MADETGTHDSVGRAAVVNYLGALSGDLAALARQHGLDTLGYILEMARLEAENAERGLKPE